MYGRAVVVLWGGGRGWVNRYLGTRALFDIVLRTSMPSYVFSTEYGASYPDEVVQFALGVERHIQAALLGRKDEPASPV